MPQNFLRRDCYWRYRETASASTRGLQVNIHPSAHVPAAIAGSHVHPSVSSPSHALEEPLKLTWIELGKRTEQVKRDLTFLGRSLHCTLQPQDSLYRERAVRARRSGSTQYDAGRLQAAVRNRDAQRRQSESPTRNWSAGRVRT
jgi:hypothetical protein